MPKKKTHEEYVTELATINPNVEVIGVYVGNRTNILHRCKIDGCEWVTSPYGMLRGNKCPECSKIKNKTKKKKKTHDEYVEELKEVNSNIEVVGVYETAKTKILHRCLIDGYEWYVAPTTILSGYGCPICGGSMRRTHEEYVKMVTEINPDIEVVGRYINASTKVLHRCKIDGHEWYVIPNSIIRGYGCPICKSRTARDRLAWTTEEYAEELSKINKDIIVIGEYVNARIHVKHKCLVCGWEWDTSPYCIMSGHGCPQCNKASKSTGEKIIASWLDDRNIIYKKQKTFDDCKDKFVLRFDFYIPKYNILIEYNGKQHYEPVDYFGGQAAFESQLLRDAIKEEYCKNNNFILFIIPYFSDINEELSKLYDLIISKDNVFKEVAV